MKKINITIVLLPCLLLACNEKSAITDREDYKQYLANDQVILTSGNEEIAFWKDRLATKKDDEAAILKLAALFAEDFKSFGDVSRLQMSDSLYHMALKKSPLDNAFIYQSLAANAITQHKFRDAQTYIEEALKVGDQRATSKLMLADIALELGANDWTKKILNEFTNKKSFAWLIRKSKLKDHEGEMDSAIILMQRAYDRIKGNKSMACWALSNLGDMYGHAGRVDDAYRNYLKVLSLNPEHHHSLKGIAWIALSHDNKLDEAKEIVDFLLKRKRMPKGHLMLAELATLSGNQKERIRQLRLFKSMVDNPAYRLMYNKYLANVEIDLGYPEKCIAIAYEEIKNRPTPQSYDLLAWGYHKKGDHSKALKTIREHVEDQTLEPESLYHMGMIYRANGFLDEGHEFLQAAGKSSFELGPATATVIENMLK